MTTLSFRIAFSKVCDAEIVAHGRGPAIGPQAAERLLQLLINGRLRAWRSARDGSNEEVFAEYWRGRIDSFKKDILPVDGVDAFGGISVDEAELRALLSQASAGSVVGPPIGNPEAKRGRPPAANPYDIAWVLGSLVYADAWGTSQADMLSKVAEKFEAEFGENSAPSRTALQPMVKRLFAEMAKHDAVVDKRIAKARN